MQAFKENSDSTHFLHYYVSRVDIFTYVSLCVHMCVCVCVCVCSNSCRINRLIFTRFGMKIIPLLITPVLIVYCN
jgi:hypothetical protein